MDTPESPTQSPQSPEEEEKGLSDSELLESPESPTEEGKEVSDSELLNDDENEGLDDGGDSDFDGDRLAADGEDPEDISDQEDYKMEGGEVENFHQQSRGSRLDASPSPEEEILETPRSPDPESPGPDNERPFTPVEEEREDTRAEDEEDDGKPTKSSLGRAALQEDEDEEEERRRRRAVMVVSDLKDESSVSRDLDEHELDYDEEVPEEPSTAAPEEEDAEKVPAEADGDDDEEDEEEQEKRRKKKERKRILPPDNTDSPRKNSVDGRVQERGRRDSFREKKKDEDDGEIDEGEIDVSVLNYTQRFMVRNALHQSPSYDIKKKKHQFGLIHNKGAFFAFLFSL